MGRRLTIVSLLLVLALPLAGHATVETWGQFGDRWGWGGTTGTGDGVTPLAPGGTLGSVNTIANTVDEQFPGWGGSWYQINGLAMHFTVETVNDNKFVTGIDWAIVSGYNGVEAYAGAADLRNGLNAGPDGAYRNDPVIRLDLDGDALYEWAVVTDNMAPDAASVSGNASANGPWEGGATLYYIPDQYADVPANYNTNPEVWRWSHPSEWHGIPPRYVDINVNSHVQTWATGDVDHNIAQNDLGVGFHNTSNEQWIQRDNWFWDGHFDLSGNQISLGGAVAGPSISYGMWCGNSIISVPGGPLLINNPVPEPGSIALLCLALGAGLRTSKRFRRKKPKS